MLYYAVLSGNETIVKTFLKLSHCNEPDSLWVSIFPNYVPKIERNEGAPLPPFTLLQNDVCFYRCHALIVKIFCIFPRIPQGFTPLHLAASQGDLSLVKFLTQFGCSIYCKDKVCLFVGFLFVLCTK